MQHFLYCCLTWVAQVIGLPALLQRPIIIFWARKTFSVGISIPRSPRATMIPSLASMISSNLQNGYKNSSLSNSSSATICYDILSGPWHKHTLIKTTLKPFKKKGFSLIFYFFSTIHHHLNKRCWYSKPFPHTCVHLHGSQACWWS